MRVDVRNNNRGGVAVNLLVISVFIFTAIFIYKQSNVCEKPLLYSIGNIDSKFGITPEKFLGLLNDAEKIWEEGTGLDLFTYQPDADAKFKVNLVFDERQRKTIAEKRAREALDIGEDSYKNLKKEYEKILAVQKTKLSTYEKEVSSYTNLLNKYNREVEHYNKSGGAPEDVYKRLESDRVFLEKTASELNLRQEELSTINNQLSLLVTKINKLAGTYNNEVAKYNNVFGSPVVFDQGEYTGSEINIYQFDEISDLRLVLAHEFGHALNLDHVDNPTSIMYYLMEKQSFKAPKLSTEDINALKIECGIK